jgi:hypothetical protein
MALGDWKSGQMMRRYAAVTDQTLRAAAEAVSRHEPVPLRGAVASVPKVLGVAIPDATLSRPKQRVRIPLGHHSDVVEC